MTAVTTRFGGSTFDNGALAAANINTPKGTDISVEAYTALTGKAVELTFAQRLAEKAFPREVGDITVVPAGSLPARSNAAPVIDAAPDQTARIQALATTAELVKVVNTFNKAYAAEPNTPTTPTTAVAAVAAETPVIAAKTSKASIAG